MPAHQPVATEVRLTILAPLLRRDLRAAGRNDRALSPPSRRRADPPSLESRPSSRAGRFAGVAASRNARAPCFASC
jgi:hypothetical protein